MAVACRVLSVAVAGCQEFPFLSTAVDGVRLLLAAALQMLTPATVDKKVRGGAWRVAACWS